MSAVNPNALAFWAACSIAGYFFGGRTLDGALAGLGVGLAISVLAVYVAGRRS